jgi:electron transport complex protein RnfG
MDIAKMAAFLFLVCSVAASALALTDLVTAERIAENKRKVEEEARQAVLGDVRFKEARKREIDLDGVEADLFEYFDESGGKVASVVKGTGKGFGGKIEFMLGVSPKGEILGVKVISHAETPGLGTNVVGDRAPFLGKLAGLKRDECVLRKDDPKGRVDSVTGVTVSSRAITRGVREVMEKLKDEFEK